MTYTTHSDILFSNNMRYFRYKDNKWHIIYKYDGINIFEYVIKKPRNNEASISRWLLCKEYSTWELGNLLKYSEITEDEAFLELI